MAGICEVRVCGMPQTLVCQTALRTHVRGSPASILLDDPETHAIVYEGNFFQRAFVGVHRVDETARTFLGKSVDDLRLTDQHFDHT